MDGGPDVLLDEADAGPVLFAERTWPPRRVLAGLVAAGAVVTLVCLVRAGLGTGLLVAAGLLALGLLLLPLFVLDNRICARAMITRTWLWGRPFVIPWEVVDPAQVRLHRRVSLIGRRLTPGEARFQIAAWSTTAVSFPGLLPVLADRRRRHRLDEGMQALVRADQLSAGLNLPSVFAMTTWVFGTAQPERFLESLESALAAGGRPGVRGLARRELADPMIEKWRR